MKTSHAAGSGCGGIRFEVGEPFGAALEFDHLGSWESEMTGVPFHAGVVLPDRRSSDVNIQMEDHAMQGGG